MAPWTASWAAEEEFFVASCRWAGGRLALCQPQQPRQDKPLFAKPHSVRQRMAIIAGLCDLCGLRLGPVKVCLSFGRQADIGEVNVEPMSHPHCAMIATANCPHLKKHVAAGTVRIREVQKYGNDLLGSPD